MIESLSDAKEELKRVDHLIYVSLKYTRTADIFVNTISRMIDAYNHMFDALIKYCIENKMTEEEMPGSPIEKGNLIKEIYKDDKQIMDNVELYFLLRKIFRAKIHEKTQEYRRHVTMKVYVDNREEIINIDIITQYYFFQNELFNRIKNLIIPPED
jgi:hypothetical protein